MKTRYRNVAFLAELMINILVFSISCAVLVGLFGKAFQVSRQTARETKAASEVQWLMENLKAGGKDALEGAEWTDDDHAVLRYDEDWNRVESDAQAVYTIKLLVSTAVGGTDYGALTSIQAVAADAGGIALCRMETASYIPNFEGQP